MIKKITVLLFLATSLNLKAQVIECGTVEPAGFSESFDKILEAQSSFRGSGDVIIYPVKAHLIRNSDGSGGLSIAQLEEAIAVMNNHFIHSNLQFFLCDGVNIIESSTLYNFDKSQENFMAQNYEVAGMINIYFANQVTSNGSALCGYAYYPGGPDRIVMSNSCATNGSTLSHEMGHFFNLPHTHGNSNTTSQGELVDGSNCQTAGDKICDTPADPLLSYNNVSVSCIYTGNEVDANGDKYVPDVKNLMSYARKECRFLFSPMQHAIMEYTAANVRKYFTCPGYGLVTEAILENGFCPGQDLTVNYHVNKPFDSSNEFSLELSSPSGGFPNPQTLGSIQSNVSGSITVALPLLAKGNAYRVRLVSSSPQIIGLNNGKNLVIDSIFPNVSLNTTAIVCLNEEIELSGGSPVGGVYSGDGVNNGIFETAVAGVGTHQISYSVSNACSTVTATQEIMVDECLSVENASARRATWVGLAPNPAKGSVILKGPDNKGGMVKVEIFSISGNLAFSQDFDTTPDQVFEQEVSLSYCTAGMYFVKVHFDDGPIIAKLLVY